MATAIMSGEFGVGRAGAAVPEHVCAAGRVVASAFRPTLPVVLAEATGAFRRHRVEVTMHLARSSDDQLARLAGGAVDVAHTALDNVVAWSATAPVRVIAVIDLGVAHELVARAPIREPHELRDAVIGVDSPRNGLVVLLATMLREAGLRDGAYELRAAGGLARRARAFADGEFDACLLAGEDLRSALASGHHRVLALRRRFPRYPAIAIIAREPLTGDRRALLSRYVAALHAATRSVGDEPAVLEAVAAVLGGTPAQAGAWLDAERTRMTGVVANADEARAVIADGLRDTGRLAADACIAPFADVLMDDGA